MTCRKVLVALKITFVGTQYLEENLSRICHTGVSIINIIGGQYHVCMYVWGVKWTTCRWHFKSAPVFVTFRHHQIYINSKGNKCLNINKANLLEDIYSFLPWSSFLLDWSLQLCIFTSIWIGRPSQTVLT